MLAEVRGACLASTASSRRSRVRMGGLPVDDVQDLQRGLAVAAEVPCVSHGAAGQEVRDLGPDQGLKFLPAQVSVGPKGGGIRLPGLVPGCFRCNDALLNGVALRCLSISAASKTARASCIPAYSSRSCSMVVVPRISRAKLAIRNSSSFVGEMFEPAFGSRPSTFATRRWRSRLIGVRPPPGP